MKTKLLSLIFAMVLTSSITNAQKTWDFSADRTNWPVSSGTGVRETSIDNLGLYANSESATQPIVNFATISASNATFPDAYAGTHRLQLNGAGFTGGTFANMPTQRFLYFNVSGACTVKVWFKTGSNGATRTVYVTNGTATLGSATTNNGTTNTTDFGIITAAYTGGSGQLYIYGDNACNIYKITVTGATVTAPIPVLGTNNFKAESAVKVYAAGENVYVSNVISATQVDVYSITGALVKSIKTSVDINFDFLNTGLYIVKVQSAEGQKTVKIAVQ